MNYLKDIAREYALRNTNKYYGLITPYEYRIMIHNRNILESLEDSDPKDDIAGWFFNRSDDFCTIMQNYFDSIILFDHGFVEDIFDQLVGDYKHEHLLLKEFHKMR